MSPGVQEIPGISVHTTEIFGRKAKLGKNKGLGEYRKFTLLEPGVFERDYLQEVLQGVDLIRFKAICIKDYVETQGYRTTENKTYKTVNISKEGLTLGRVYTVDFETDSDLRDLRVKFFEILRESETEVTHLFYMAKDHFDEFFRRIDGNQKTSKNKGLFRSYLHKITG